MCKRINPLWVGAFFFLCASALASDEVDWSVFAAWCPAGFEVCATSSLSDDIALDDVVAPGYHAPSDDDAHLFSELLSVYQALTQGRTVSDLDSYIRRLKADITVREQLHRYAASQDEVPAQPSRGELRHYRKELMYLKSLQAVNQKQMQLLDARQDDEALLVLKSQVVTLERQLEEGIAALGDQLQSDIKAEKHILRYFMYKREQVGE
ncbi:hypothetical protein [Vibrio parahaemolyticus]|uniref:hypothetical protein n=1 Tax=Vibrio parahaemolyticus TaxID=670 RepID=UPI0015DE69E3|nr:hypothetical protein [Vibrio parahaemolyticus]